MENPEKEPEVSLGRGGLGGGVRKGEKENRGGKGVHCQRCAHKWEKEGLGGGGPLLSTTTSIKRRSQMLCALEK